MKTNFPTKKILIIFLILNTIVLSAYFYLFSVIKSKNEAVSILENVLGGQVSREGELKLIGSSLGKTEEERVLIDSFFVKEGKSGVADFVEVVEEIANLSHVSLVIKSILIKKQENLSVVENINLGLGVKGSWSESVYFLKLLELIPYKVSFESVYFEKNKENLMWNVNLNIKVLKLSDN